jgi:hypothetical protein
MDSAIMDDAFGDSVALPESHESQMKPVADPLDIAGNGAQPRTFVQLTAANATDGTPGGAKTGSARGAGKEVTGAEHADVEVRITPLSLLFSSVLGASVLGAIFAGGLFLLPAADLLPGNADSFLSQFVSPLLAYGALLLAIFLVGYRRHGRPVPTEARVREGTLAVRVPEAWGTLIREEFHLVDPRLERLRPRERPGEAEGKPGPSGSMSPAGPKIGDLLARGRAREWWDPGTYEVRAEAEAAKVLRRGLASEGEERSVR